jgi:NAD+ kinase
MAGDRLINIISNKNYESRKTARLLSTKLRDNSLIPTEVYSKDAELNICIGGDGAFLRAIHRNAFPEIPFVGINTGHLGFFQEISPKEIDTFIERYLLGDYQTENIFLVDAKVCTKKKCFYLTGVNEIVIKGVKSKIVHLDVFIDNNHLEKFSGDGLIVSTPAGSTGYNFSAGGSIVYPNLSSLQITPLAPISSSAYRSLPNSAIVPGKSIIIIKPEYRYENSILVVNDGMEFRYDSIISIDLTMSPKNIYKLNFSKDMYWNNLKSKFL